MNGKEKCEILKNMRQQEATQYGLQNTGSLPPPELKMCVKFKECSVAGWNFRDPEDFWDELYEGAALTLVRERDNKYDRNAVGVALSCDVDDPREADPDFFIGYVPRTENEFIAQMLDLGWDDVFMAELTTVNDHGAYADRLRMTIYLQSREYEVFEDEECMFAQQMDDADFAEFTAQLEEQGYVYRRLPVCLPDHDEFPDEGDTVLIIHKLPTCATLYFLRVVARGEKCCAPFLKISEEPRIDDCEPFVFTNIKGPITCAKEEMAFLDDERISSCYPEGRLSEYAVRCLKKM